MPRAQLAAYLQRYNLLALAAGLLDTRDDATGYGPAIDDCLRFLGVLEVDLQDTVLDQTQVGDALALVRYTALGLLLDLLAIKIDLQADTPTVNAKRSQMFAQTQIRFNAALADITQRGYGPQDFDYGKLQLDIFEPPDPSIGAGITGGYGYWNWY